MAEAERSKVSVFVSYARADMEPRPNVNSSRLGELYAELKYDLGANDERSDIRFVRDSEGMIRLGDRIEETIGSNIEEADIALIFLSQHYCRSDSCELEIKKILSLNRKIFLVELDDTWATRDDHLMVPYRDELKDVLSARFWDKSDNSIRFYGYPLPTLAEEQSRKLYNGVLQSLGSDIRSASRSIKEAKNAERAESEHEENGGTPPSAQHVNVVLASPTSDTKDETDRLEKSFENENFSVLRLDRVDVAPTAALMREYISSGDVFVQVLGSMPGRKIPEIAGKPSAIAQFELAEEAGIEIAAWISNDFDISECDDAHAQFLHRIVSHRSSFEEFETYVVKQVREKIRNAQSVERREQRRSMLQDPDTPLVSIDAAEADADLRDRIKRALDKHVDVDCIDFNTDFPGLKKAVRDNDAIVLIYGVRAEGQNRARAHWKLLRRLRTLVWNEEHQRFEIAFGDASPVGGLPCPTGPDIHVIRVDDEIDQSSMRRFLASLGVEAVTGADL